MEFDVLNISIKTSKGRESSVGPIFARVLGKQIAIKADVL